jgi:pectin methylesterase-like acyl-CoA thioesterase
LVLKVVAIVALAIAIAAAVFIFSMPRQTSPGAPNVKFTEFSADRLDIKVGETTNIVFNVQNLESRAINNSRVTILVEPSGYQPYLSIDKPTVELPYLQGKDARTGQMQVGITATGSPAKEAVYTVKGLLLAEGMQSDVREFELRIRQ